MDVSYSRRATVTPADHGKYDVNFNPRPPHGGRRFNLAVSDMAYVISIHALLTEGDVDII